MASTSSSTGSSTGSSKTSGVGIISVVITTGRNIRVVEESRTEPYCVVDLLTSDESGVNDEEHHQHHPIMSLKSSHSRTESGGGSSSHGIGIGLLKKKKNKKKIDPVWNETYHFPVDMHETYTKLLHWNFKFLRVQVMSKAADSSAPSGTVLEHKLGEVIFPFIRLKNNIEIDEWFKLKQTQPVPPRKASSSSSNSNCAQLSTSPTNSDSSNHQGPILEKPKGEIRMKLLYLDAATHKRKIKEKEEQNKQSRLLGYMDEVLKSFMYINNEVRNKSNLMFMLDMMRENQSVYVQMKAIKFLSQYTKSPDPERKRLAIELNGVDLISESMKNFPNIVELQRDARQTVANLSTDEFRPLLIAKGLVRPRRF